jgi:predicted ATP-grasp superfamily ATP-dependent carboligase
MRILVTDGDNRATLAITRALGRLGHHILVGDKGAGALAQASRYCHTAVRYPDPVAESDHFVSVLARLAREHQVDAVLPVADITTFLVTGHRDQFACAVPCADAEVVARAANKVDIVRIAEEIGVPVPASVVVHDPQVIPPTAHLGFPLVIKPWQSRIRTAAGWASTGVSYADTPAELASDLAARPPHEFPVLLQERLVGPGVGVFACVHDGRPVATFSHRRLRERPPWGGVSVLCESAEVDPAAGDHAARLLAAIGWQGVAMVEFKRDLRDGVPKLMEINGRFWGSLQLAIDAGVNFPALLVQTITGEPFAPQPPYRVGIRERWLWGDVDALLVTLRPGRNAARLAGRSRLRAIGDFLEFRAADLHYDNPKWDDRAPFAAETRSWFRKLAAGARRDRGATPESAPAAATPPVSGS